MAKTATVKSAKEEAPGVRDRILSAAEELFAQTGLHGVSLREIARAADVSGPMASYHFPDKTELWLAVIKRRADHLNLRRAALLDELDLRYAPDAPPVDEIIRTILRPIFEFAENDGVGWERFWTMLGKEWPSDHYDRAMRGGFEIILRRYVTFLHRALPAASRNDISFLLDFVISAMSSVRPNGTVQLYIGEFVGTWLDRSLEDRLVAALSAAAKAYS